MKTKTFDCLRMKREGAEQVMKRLERKSPAEQLEYWEQGTEDLKRRRQKLKENRVRPNPVRHVICSWTRREGGVTGGVL